VPFLRKKETDEAPPTSARTGLAQAWAISLRSPSISRQPVKRDDILRLLHREKQG